MGGGGVLGSKPAEIPFFFKGAAVESVFPAEPKLRPQDSASSWPHTSGLSPEPMCLCLKGVLAEGLQQQDLLYRFSIIRAFLQHDITICNRTAGT